MTRVLLTVLPYALPPLLGALIGYVTNKLAIRMLFRPLTEKRVLGVRVPLTPGVIPRQRHELARSVARMVSTKLITDEVLLRRLQDPSFVSALEASVSRFTDDVLSGERPADESAATVRRGVREMATGVLSSFFRSDLFGEVVHRLAESAATGALGMRAGQLLPAKPKTVEFVRGVIGSLAHGPVAPTAERAIQRWIADHLERDTPLVEIVGRESLDRVAAIAPGLYNPLLEAVLAFLREQKTRKELAIHGRDLLNRILRRLNLVQRLLVSAGQYDRNISENMPAVIDDLIQSVESAGRNPENRDGLIDSIQAEVHELGRTGVRTLFERFGLQADRMVMRLFVVAVDLLGRDEVQQRVCDTVVRFLDRQRPRSLGELLEAIAGVPPEELARRVVAVVDGWIERERDSDQLALRVVEFAMRYVGAGERRPLGEVLPLSAEQKHRVDRFLAHRLQSAMERRVPEIIASIDVYAMVVEKIDGLDVESVEQLLLMVIARHLKWINLFGALLGSLIGGVQVLVGLLG